MTHRGDLPGARYNFQGKEAKDLPTAVKERKKRTPRSQTHAQSITGKPTALGHYLVAEAKKDVHVYNQSIQEKLEQVEDGEFTRDAMCLRRLPTGKWDIQV